MSCQFSSIFTSFGTPTTTNRTKNLRIPINFGLIQAGFSVLRSHPYYGMSAIDDSFRNGTSHYWPFKLFAAFRTLTREA